MSNETAEAFRAAARGLHLRIRWGYDPTYGASDEDAARDKAMEETAAVMEQVADAIDAGTVGTYADQ